MNKIFYLWLPLAITITLMSGLVYITIQQSYRISANDPQIQLAEDLASSLNKASDVTAILTQLDKNQAKVEISSSLAPYLMIADTTGKVTVSTATLDGQTPTLPTGIFDKAKSVGENRLTWQPKAGVRGAIIIVHYKSANHEGFVVVGRSLKEVESRIADLTREVALAWLASLVISFTGVAMVRRVNS